MNMFLALMFGFLFSSFVQGLILTASVWVVDSHEFKYGTGAIVLKSILICFVTNVVWGVLGLIALSTGVLPLGLLGLVMALVTWFVLLMNDEYGFGMTFGVAFIVTLITIVFSFALQHLIGML